MVQARASYPTALAVRVSLSCAVYGRCAAPMIPGAKTHQDTKRQKKIKPTPRGTHMSPIIDRYFSATEPCVSTTAATAVTLLLLFCVLPLTLSKPPGKGRQGISHSNRTLLQRRSQDSSFRRVVDIFSRTRHQTHDRLAYSSIRLLHHETSRQLQRVCKCLCGKPSEDARARLRWL